MGGYGSGRHSGRPTADVSIRIDLAWLMRTRRVVPGALVSGALQWTWNGEPHASISYEADMRDAAAGVLRLSYKRGGAHDSETVRQTVRMSYTLPHYGGRRWWMICPYSGKRAAKLYLPPGGDRFAGRAAWRLPYASQRVEHSQRPFEAIFRIQKKLGCEPGWEAGLYRPKGMHRRTFERHRARYEQLDAQCAVAMMGVVNRLGGRSAFWNDDWSNVRKW